MAFQSAKFRRRLLSWYRRHGRDLPWRRTPDPYAVLVSEFMLQQTPVATVIRCYNAWLRRFPNFASLACASEDEVLRAWQGLGYYARARNLHTTARMIVNRHGGYLPRAIEQMRQLPGIGKYTAHALASFAFNQSVPIVEANTARVLARLFNFRGRIDSGAGWQKLWHYAGSLVPKSNARTFNSALVDLGALVCLPHKPKCPVCPVKNFCRAENPAAPPIKKPRPHTKPIIEKHAVVFQQGRILLEKSRHRWRSMWILPPLKLDCLKQSSWQHPLYEAVFPFTHHRITLAVYHRPAPRRIAPDQGWFESIDNIAMPSPHRRAAQALIERSLNIERRAVLCDKLCTEICEA